MPEPILSSSANKRQYIEDFFVYQLSLGPIAPAGVANGNIQIQADSDFKWMQAAYFVTDNATGVATFNPPATIQIVDSGTGRQLLSSPTNLQNIFGVNTNGSLPFVLPIPRIFRARSNLAITVTNNDPALTINFDLAFIGTKIFQL